MASCLNNNSNNINTYHSECQNLLSFVKKKLISKMHARPSDLTINNAVFVNFIFFLYHSLSYHVYASLSLQTVFLRHLCLYRPFIPTPNYAIPIYIIPVHVISTPYSFSFITILTLHLSCIIIPCVCMPIKILRGPVYIKYYHDNYFFPT